MQRKNSIGPLRIQKNHTHICYSIILYNIIVKRHDPYSAIVIKSLLHFYAKIIHSHALIMTPDANYCVVLWCMSYAPNVTVFLYNKTYTIIVPAVLNIIFLTVPIYNKYVFKTSLNRNMHNN